VTFDLVVAKTEIEEANRNFMQSFSKGDSVGLANCYTTDAKALVPNIPAIEGRNNIQHIFAGFIKSGVQKKC
jgi:ketosteroid isomerase-like protein